VSAVLCSFAHISALAEYAVVHQIWARGSYTRDDINKTDAEVLAEQLFAENLRSVNARYPRKAGDVPFIFSRDTRAQALAASPVEIIKAAECLAYHSDEHRSENVCTATCQAIIKHAIRLLPGYEQASWGWQ